MKIHNHKLKNSQRTIKVASFYDKKQKWKVIVPTIIYKFLDEQLENIKPFPTFKRDIALYFLSLIMSVSANKKDKIYKDRFVPLNSKILEKCNYNYKKYFDYFLEIGIVEKRNYCTDCKNGSRSNSYKYNYSKISKDGIVNFDFTVFEINFQKLKNREENLFAIETCNHLTKWINEDLDIDYDEAIKSLSEEIKFNKYSDDNFYKIEKKAYNYWYSIIAIKHKIFHASRNENKDNRLHTNLTNMSKNLKPFIKFRGERIKSIDVKSSQPYFLMYLLERKGKERVREKVEKVLEIWGIDREVRGIMFEKITQILCCKDFEREFTTLKGWMREGLFYEKLGELFSYIKSDNKGNFKLNFYDKNIQKTQKLSFKNKRSLMKKLALQILYTPLQKPSKEYTFFKSKFPCFVQVTEIIKSLKPNDKNSFKIFPMILQHLESDCILDFITYNFSKKYPEIPIFTIHDSIATTIENFPILEKWVKILFEKYTNGFIPILDNEEWK